VGNNCLKTVDKKQGGEERRWKKRKKKDKKTNRNNINGGKLDMCIEKTIQAKKEK
jgi:hypothetical protein